MLALSNDQQRGVRRDCVADSASRLKLSMRAPLSPPQVLSNRCIPEYGPYWWPRTHLEWMKHTVIRAKPCLLNWNSLSEGNVRNHFKLNKTIILLITKVSLLGDSLDMSRVSRTSVIYITDIPLGLGLHIKNWQRSRYAAELPRQNGCSSHEIFVYCVV
jgi:hypothetical protein